MKHKQKKQIEEALRIAFGASVSVGIFKGATIMSAYYGGAAITSGMAAVGAIASGGIVAGLAITGASGFAAYKLAPDFIKGAGDAYNKAKDKYNEGFEFNMGTIRVSVNNQI